MWNHKCHLGSMHSPDMLMSPFGTIWQPGLNAHHFIAHSAITLRFLNLHDISCPWQKLQYTQRTWQHLIMPRRSVTMHNLWDHGDYHECSDPDVDSPLDSTEQWLGTSLSIWTISIFSSQPRYLCKHSHKHCFYWHIPWWLVNNSMDRLYHMPKEKPTDLFIWPFIKKKTTKILLMRKERQYMCPRSFREPWPQGTTPSAQF